MLSLYAFLKAYKEFNFGYASALATVMFLLLMLLQLYLWLLVQYIPLQMLTDRMLLLRIQRLQFLHRCTGTQ